MEKLVVGRRILNMEHVVMVDLGVDPGPVKIWFEGSWPADPVNFTGQEGSSIRDYFKGVQQPSQLEPSGPSEVGSSALMVGAFDFAAEE